MKRREPCPECDGPLEAGQPSWLCPFCALRDLSVADVRVPERDFRRGPFRAGFELGDYRLLEEVGAGGMGVVYRAVQRSLGRMLAVKVLHSQPQTDPTRLRRFQAEALAAGSLRHPHIVTVHDAGVHEGWWYFAMDFVAGRSLAAIAHDAPLPADRIAGWMKSIGEAIQHAHDRGVLHRDLKPSNVMIDEWGQPLVLDFGLARRLDEDSSLTLSGQVLGSPNYMAPEQASGSRHSVGRATDVYGLGAILYHLLTGRPPAQGASMLETLQEVLRANPPAPRWIRPGVSVELETICLKCLNRDPERRYASAQDVADDLDRFLKGEPIRARPVNRTEKAWLWCRRNPTFAATLAVMLGLLMAVAVGGPVAVLRLRAERNQSEGLLYVRNLHQANDALDNHDLARARLMLEAVAQSPIQSALRGWEWRYVAGRCHDDAVAELGRHESYVEDVAVTAEGRWAVSISAGGRIRVWSLLDRREAGTWNLGSEGTDPDLRCGLVPHPTRPWVFVGHGQGQVALFTVPDGRMLWSRTNVAGGVVRLAVSADGRRLATAGLFGRIGLWHLDGSAEPVPGQSWDSGVLIVRALGFGSDGSELYVAGPTGQAVRRYGLDSGENGEPRRLPDLGGTGAPMAVSAFRGMLVTSDGEGRSVLGFSLPGPVPRTTRTLAGSKASAMAMTSISPAFALGFDDGRIWWWRDFETGEPVELWGHVDPVIALGFSPDARFLLSGGYAGAVRLWEAGASERRGREWSPGGKVHDLAFAPDSRTVVTVAQRHRGTADANPIRFCVAEIWNLNEPGEPRRIGVISNEASGLNFSVGVSTDGTMLAVDDFEHLWFHRLDTAAPVSRMDARLPRFHPKGPGLFFVEHTRIAWVAEPGAPPRTVIQETSEITALAATLDHRTLATAALADRGKIRLRDAGSGRIVRTLEGHSGWVSSVSFSPDSTTLASTGWDEGFLRFWDVRGRRPPVALRGHNGGIFRAVFSPDGSVVATCGNDDTVRLWHVATRQEVAVLRGHRGAIKGLAFSPDGRWLGSASEDGTVRLWPAPLDADSAEARTVRADAIPRFPPGP